MTFFSWPAGCKQAWYKPRQGKHHAKVFIDFFVLLIWWCGWTLLKCPIKKAVHENASPMKFGIILIATSQRYSNTYQRRPGSEQRITWFLSQGMQNAVSQCWVGSESLIQWASVPDKMSGREVTGQRCSSRHWEPRKPLSSGNFHGELAWFVLFYGWWMMSLDNFGHSNSRCNTGGTKGKQRG